MYTPTCSGIGKQVIPSRGPALPQKEAGRKGKIDVFASKKNIKEDIKELTTVSEPQTFRELKR